MNSPRTFFRRKSVLSDRYDASTKRSTSLNYEAKSVDFDSKNVEEIDNVKVNFKKINKELLILHQHLQQTMNNDRLLKNEMKMLYEKKEEEIKKM